MALTGGAAAMEAAAEGAPGAWAVAKLEGWPKQLLSGRAEGM